MRKIHILATFAATVTFISSVSCQKGETLELEPSNDPVFSATIDNGKTKTYVDGTKILWELYDEITITDASSTSAIYQVKVIGSDGTATFVKKAGEASTLGDGPYTAVYGPTIPSCQIEGSTLMDLPMSAYSATTTLHFTATCGILKISIAPMKKKIKRILVRNENATSDNNFVLICSGGGSGINLAEGATFEIIVPAATYTYFNFIMSDGTGAEKRAQSVTVEPNHIKPIKVETMDFLPTYELEEEDYSGVGVRVNGIIWAPVNCGYTADTPRGLHYQWAKKQGFAITGDVPCSKKPVEKMSDGIGLTYFIYDEKCWYEEYEREDVWPTDSDYNPCPEGWRVPTGTELNVLQSNHISNKWITNGKIEGKGNYTGCRFPATGEPSIFLPAVGRRDLNLDAEKINSRGCYWSSDLDAGHKYDSNYLYIEEDEVIGYFYTYRTFGMSVRCVHD